MRIHDGNLRHPLRQIAGLALMMGCTAAFASPKLISPDDLDVTAAPNAALSPYALASEKEVNGAALSPGIRAIGQNNDCTISMTTPPGPDRATENADFARLICLHLEATSEYGVHFGKE